jgi:hypothetical protein
VEDTSGQPNDPSLHIDQQQGLQQQKERQRKQLHPIIGTNMGCIGRPEGHEQVEDHHVGHHGLGRQLAVMVAMSFGCLLDGSVIAYACPALPSLQLPSSPVQIDHLALSWIGRLV